MTEIKFPKYTQPNSESTSTTGENTVISKTLFIFDFDDTLFCTKYFDSFSLPYQDIFTYKISLEQTNPCLFKEIKELEKVIIELFVKLQSNNYDVVIVSNADMKWITNCLTHFLEELKEYIHENNMKVYSAKNLFSNSPNMKSTEQGHRESTGWKIKCFEKVIKDLYSDENENNINETSIDLNVVSIGDGEDEKKAVLKLNKKKFNFCQNLQSKFIRMIDYPSASSIITQLEYLQNNINEIIDDNKTIYKMVIEIVNGTTQVKCVPKKKKAKIDNNGMVTPPHSSIIADKKKSKNLEKLKKMNEDEYYLFNNYGAIEEEEDLIDNNLLGLLNNEEELLRKNLFLGKKKFF
jgi:hypothetical protein